MRLFLLTLALSGCARTRPVIIIASGVTIHASSSTPGEFYQVLPNRWGR